MFKRINNQSGWSLLELMVITSILGVLAGIMTSSLQIYSDTAEYGKAEVAQRNALTAIEAGSTSIEGIALIDDWSGQFGEPLAGDLANALPGMVVPVDVQIHGIFVQCADGSSESHAVNFITYACGADQYLAWVKTCGGVISTLEHQATAHC